MKLSHLFTMLLGLAVIAVITPLSQFLTINTVNAEIETATPVGWAVGLLFSLVLALAAVRLLARLKLLSKANMVLLYAMLTVAVPVMNLGLVRQTFLSMYAVTQEYVHHGTNTYHTAYNAQPHEWFPKVPTREGLAWNKAETLLDKLRDRGVLKRRDRAMKEVFSALLAEAQRIRLAAETQPTTGPAGTDSPLPPPPKPAETANLRKEIAHLWVDNVEKVRVRARQLQAGGDLLKGVDLLRRLGLPGPLDQQRRLAGEQSRQAAERVPKLLADLDEFDLVFLPEFFDALDPSSQDRAERQKRRHFARVGQAGQQALQEKVRALGEQIPLFRREVTLLGRDDYIDARAALRDLYLARYRKLSREDFDDLRNSFVFRLPRRTRADLTGQRGLESTPDQFIAGFRDTIWIGPKADQAKQELKLREKLRDVWRTIPWPIWRRPMILWGLLFVTLFLLLMCLAEWLRRKWIARENLAFPLVDVADHIIRHDSRLEVAEDLQQPEPRKHLFNGVFLLGLGLGFVWLTVEAVAHYGLVQMDKGYIYLDLSKVAFQTGALRALDRIYIVISPIIVGLAFLVSLEVSFSIWMTFVLWKVVFWVVKLADPNIKDSIYTGWSGGRTYPFAMEQFLGACVCFGAVLLYKSWRVGRQHGQAPLGDPFIPPKLNLAGLIVLPLVAAGLLWHLGITNIPLLLLAGGLLLAQTIVAARVRAETGLPTQHCTYEFTKLPLVFGLTGLTGAKVYTLFITVAFLPVSLLFRTLPQLLENMELARRCRLKLRTVAVSAFLAFAVALGVGMVCFMVGSYYKGTTFWVEWNGLGGQRPGNFATARYPLWVSHFLGEQGLDKYTSPHWIRVVFMLIGFTIFGMLMLLRKHFLRFPLHPVGYIVVMLSFYYAWVTPYFKGDGTANLETCTLWGSVLVAWGVKKLIIKYGGMNTYRRAKPLFIGLVVGAVVCVFAFNILDLVCSMVAENRLSHGLEVGDLLKNFVDKPPYSPKFY